ncbi:hypothetical protein [Candidatus Uabimicrobium sp. HlEnr_7]|uniref:hypothetical protein n=1 Tax=Candidatus Uabimicrobium helgolandensis TaxID=3095367 RepID=UPI00355756A7
MIKLFSAICLLSFSICYAQDLHAVEVRHFDIKKFLSKAGNIRLDDNGSISKMERVVEELLFKAIRVHLQANNLEKQLHSIEIIKSDIVCVATLQVNNKIETFLNQMKVNRSFSVQIQMVRAIPLDKIEWLLKKKEDWQYPNVHILVDSVTPKQAKNEIEIHKENHYKVMSSPTISINDLFINKLEMASKQKLHYISGYQYAKVAGEEKMITIPQLKKLERKFDLYLLPIPKKNKEHHLHLHLTAADYLKPIKKIKTQRGPIHSPQLYKSKQMLILAFKTPTTIRIVVGPNQKQEVNILYINIDLSKNKPTGLLSGRVIAKVERKITWNEEQVDLPQMGTQYILETGKSTHINKKSFVSLYRKNNDKKIADGVITEIKDQVCIAEFTNQITIPLSEVYFSIHAKK